MRKLERIAIVKLADLVQDAMEKCSVKHADKMNYQRAFIHHDLTEMVEILNALLEEDPNEEKTIRVIPHITTTE